MVLIDQLTREPPALTVPGHEVAIDERAARRTLQAQIARLERELADAIVGAFPHVCVPEAPAPARGPRVLDLGELERVRVDLAERVGGARLAISERAEHEARSRALLEEMLREPARHKWVRVWAADVGERSCGAYHVRPRLGIVGMLMGWWHVKVSSGCPLATPA
ncbi:MAG: hypothetical protein QOC54_2480 [Baekduia sp.]|nr:hypothetical protein [Baekduia sp.]